MLLFTHLFLQCFFDYLSRWMMHLLNTCVISFISFQSHRLDQIDKLSLDKNQYDNFAYHTALLNDFVRNQTKNNKSDGLTSSAHFVRGRNGFGGGGSIRQMTGSNASSVNSNYSSSMMMMRRGSNSNSNNNLKNVFKSMSKRKSTTKSSSSSMKRSVSTSAF